MSRETIEMYKSYMNKIGDRYSIYKAVVEKFDIKSAIYPGSHIDITPSIIIPKVIYIDNFKGAISFFKNLEGINEYLNKHKDYVDSSNIKFINSDYNKTLNIDEVDLIISQYAGFVGQATKKYLKIKGILLVNDSHGDATLAKFDDSFKFLGVVEHNYKGYRINTKDIEQYFKLYRNKEVDLEMVKSKMKGPKYKVSAENYLFQKIK